VRTRRRQGMACRDVRRRQRSCDLDRDGHAGSLDRRVAADEPLLRMGLALSSGTMTSALPPKRTVRIEVRDAALGAAMPMASKRPALRSRLTPGARPCR